ncbi:uncharacterized protein NKAPD1 [Chelmon rostratus]|uniref:uncharacterized protein NKAPD1 n=1 Tax=Chelmon rostratus TaxID=109905 RepID=UPI001BEC49FA|nr:uncharacterized protein NKAPD1 [Chelmon rostratus]
MSKQPLGKTLLRNVIRHTDAHNKIQEEMEMWKMRGWEVQMSHHNHLSGTERVRGRMHCDRVPDQPRELSQSRVSEHDDREARYWTRKLYDFESNDPDRWGHSGFKELYPEEFESDGEKSSATKKIGRHKLKKSKSDTEASLAKQSKKRKKKKKKKKKDEEDRRKRTESSSSSDDSGAIKDKQRRKRTKSRHKNKKKAKTRGRDEDSSSGDSNDEEEKERRTHSRKKRKQDSHRDSDSWSKSKKKRRKNWKAAGEESSRDSSGD